MTFFFYNKLTSHLCFSVWWIAAILYLATECWGIQPEPMVSLNLKCLKST